tara:strand:+ start:1233 stop:1514 length:282 start_codon:yes stop_codon:yes gene_type:complete
MKVRNITSSNGNKIANQFEIIDNENNIIYFQSYKSIIVKHDMNLNQVYLDSYFWDYSTTTSKYRNIFLNEKKKDTEKKIKEGIYILTNLNKGQ